jgi:hypothetical protein
VRVREVVPDSVGDRDAEYVAGLRATAAAGFDFILTGIEQGEGWSAVVPVEAIEQARRAARNGVGLDAVLRRYMVGQALLWDYVMQEAARVCEDGVLREMLRVQASLLDRLVMDVAREHVSERERAGRSSEQRLAERVLALLAGRPVVREGDGGVSGLDLGYELEAEHLGVIAGGARAREALRAVAVRLDRRLLCVGRGEGTVWGWLGGRHGFEVADLERVVSAHQPAQDVSFAVGEPARGLAGWRLTHQQAQAAFVVALRCSQKLTRYADVALLAAALKDEALGRVLIDVYILPLEDSRNSGVVLRETLRAYMAVGCNTSSAAAALGVLRKTVESRLRTSEERLGRSLHPYPAELEVALRLDALGVSQSGAFEF